MDGITRNNAQSTRSKKLPVEMEDEVKTPGYIFVLSEEEKKARLFHLRYSTKDDVYYRYGQREPAVKGWKEGAFTVVNMQRYHADKGPQIGEWAYLTRKPRHSSGSISWFIDLAGSGLVVDQVYALTFSRTLCGGHITYDMRRSHDPSRKGNKTESGISGLIFVAYLDGGLGKRERAQTQLFFQDCIDDPEGFPFDLLITLKPPHKREAETKNQTTERGPLTPLSFPPKPHIVPEQPPRCTCLQDRQAPHTSASVEDFRDNDDTRCYAQDEGEIIASERLENHGTEICQNIENNSSRTNDVNGNGSVSMADSDRTIANHDAAPQNLDNKTPSNPKGGKVAPIKDPCHGPTGLAQGDANSLARTERNSEAPKSQEHRTSHRFSEASIAWEHGGIGQENLVERRRKSRCVIL